jgi:hypothetical protein
MPDGRRPRETERRRATQARSQEPSRAEHVPVGSPPVDKRNRGSVIRRRSSRASETEPATCEAQPDLLPLGASADRPRCRRRRRRGRRSLRPRSARGRRRARRRRGSPPRRGRRPPLGGEPDRPPVAGLRKRERRPRLLPPGRGGAAHDRRPAHLARHSRKRANSAAVPASRSTDPRSSATAANAHERTSSTRRSRPRSATAS